MSNAVVTGAGRSIGRGIALRLARDGHAVAVNDVNKAGAESVAEEIADGGGPRDRGTGGRHRPRRGLRVVDRPPTSWAALDVMVANAGIAQVKALLDVTPEDLARSSRSTSSASSTASRPPPRR